MDWGGSAPVVLLLVCLHASQVYGASLTNVTFHCHNLHNVLKWGYDQPSPGLSFRLYIGTIRQESGFPKDLWFDPPSHEVDLSFLSDPINDYLLELTAMIANKSAADSVELTFSYFKDSNAQRKCSVDLPAVNVTALPDKNVKFQFRHPWLVYHKRLSGRSNPRHRKRASNSYEEMEGTLPEFSYVVKMDQDHHDFVCYEQLCEETLPVEVSQKKHCLTIVGELERMRVRGTDVYCAEPYQSPSVSSSHIVPIVSCAVVVFVVALVAFMVYKNKTSPGSDPQRPRSTKAITNSHPSPMKVERDKITVPVLEPASPTPLLEPTTVVPEITDDHIPRVMMEDEGVVGDAEVEQVSGEEPGYRLINMDDDESENSNQGSGYERRPHFRQPTA